MMGITSSRAALALSATALFVALGGTGLAVTQIGTGKIGTSQIKNFAVTTSKLHDGAVTNKKLATGAVRGSKLADGSVGNSKLANNAVTGDKVKDGSLTASDVQSGTFLAADGTAADSQKLGGLPANQYVQGRGFAPVGRHVVPAGGGGITIFATGFGTFSGACSNANVPTVSYTPDRNGENFEATVTSDGGSPITKIDTENAIGSGVAHPIDNSAGGRQSISFQVGFSDIPDHMATGTITSQFLFGTGCLFMAQGLTTG
jgi:hypothetical protein